MIYVFGNSHANTFTSTRVSNIGIGGSNEDFTSVSLGPVIAYNFFEHHYPRVLAHLREIDFKKDDKILLAVGEVDCRWHLPLRAHQAGADLGVTVDECVDRFFRAHLDLKQRGCKVVGWGSHPSTTDGHSDDPNAPIFGDCLFRNQISKRWARRIESLCNEHEIEFLSIFDDLIDESTGMTKMEFYSDYCHLDPEKFVALIGKKLKRDGKNNEQK